MLGYVYLIQNLETGHYKIGVTRKDINKRLEKLLTGNEDELYIRYYIMSYHPFRLETMLHNYYKLNKILNEWYDLDLNQYLEFPKIAKELNNKISNYIEEDIFEGEIK